MERTRNFGQGSFFQQRAISEEELIRNVSHQQPTVPAARGVSDWVLRDVDSGPQCPRYPSLKNQLLTVQVTLESHPLTII